MPDEEKRRENKLQNLVGLKPEIPAVNSNSKIYERKEKNSISNFSSSNRNETFSDRFESALPRKRKLDSVFQ